MTAFRQLLLATLIPFSIPLIGVSTLALATEPGKTDHAEPRPSPLRTTATRYGIPYEALCAVVRLEAESAKPTGPHASPRDIDFDQIAKQLRENLQILRASQDISEGEMVDSLVASWTEGLGAVLRPLAIPANEPRVTVAATE